jgi:elongation factor P
MEEQALYLRKGKLVEHEGRICEVVHWNILRNDRRQFVQMRIRDLHTGRITEFKEHGESRWKVFESQIVDLHHSYRDGPQEVFYTPEGEEYRCSAEAAEPALKWQVDSYKGLLVDGALATVTLPNSVVCTVAATAPPTKGGSGTKDAVLDNGIKVRVGLLVDVGDRVRLDPETGEYKERVTG